MLVCETGFRFDHFCHCQFDWWFPLVAILLVVAVLESCMKHILTHDPEGGAYSLYMKDIPFTFFTRRLCEDVF